MRTLLVQSDFHATKRALVQEGLVVDAVNNGKEANLQLRKDNYEIVILNLESPKDAEISLVKYWRCRGVKAYVMVTTSSCTPATKVSALNAGADDCLMRPYPIDELLARIRAYIRGSKQLADPVLRIHDLEIDNTARVVRRAGKVVPLTLREFEMLRFLAAHRGEEVSRADIWDHMYSSQEECKSNVIDVYIRYLRKKIDQGFNFKLILTCWGKGYMLRGNSA